MDHQQRVKDELKKAGLTKYALLKAESQRLHTIIHKEEHVMAAVFGRTQVGSAILVATDLRVIYLDIKPIFKIMDEISYEVISGITHDEQAGFAHVVLHSRIGDYAIRYAHPRCANRFADYIERVRINVSAEGSYGKRPPATPNRPKTAPTQQAIITQEALTFLRDHDLGVLATVNKDQEPHATAVYYTVNDTGVLYILTKSGTQKLRNITGNHTVAFTVYDEQNLQTLQLQATATIEPDARIRQKIYNTASHERFYSSGLKKPPVTQLQEGSFTVIRITPTNIIFRDYSE